MAILIGCFNKEKIDAAALAKYVKNGGRLYLNDGQLKVINAKLEKEGLEKCERVVIVPDFVDAAFRGEKASFYPHKFKKIASGEKMFPVVQDLMRKLQDELLPVKVEGDVQWGVNKTEKGWLVWFLNNKGVTKYAREEEIVDHGFDAEVKVTDKKTGKVYTTKIAAGGWSYVIVD